VPLIDIAELSDLLPPQGRLMGMDPGTETLGLAISDVLRTLSSPLETIRRVKFSKDVELLKKLVAQHRPHALVIGWPVNMDGSEGPRCQSVKQLVRNLEPHLPELPVVLWDERLSTAAVTRTLLEADVSRQKRRDLYDKMAAAYILQGVLDYLQRQSR
jgi:putative Holliday junction resolvase